jgi:hypothetical protein
VNKSSWDSIFQAYFLNLVKSKHKCITFWGATPLKSKNHPKV